MEVQTSFKRVDVVGLYLWGNRELQIAVECGQTDENILDKTDDFFHVTIHIPYDYATRSVESRRKGIKRKISGKINGYIDAHSGLCFQNKKRVILRKKSKPSDAYDRNWYDFRGKHPRFWEGYLYWDGVIDNMEGILEDDYSKGRR